MKKVERELESEYEAWLQGALRDIFNALSEEELSVPQIAARARLAIGTVYNLLSGETMCPRAKTVFKLAASAGLMLSLREAPRQARRLFKSLAA